MKQNPAGSAGSCLVLDKLLLHVAEAVVDRAKRVADDRAEDHQRCDNNDGNQNKN